MNDKKSKIEIWNVRLVEIQPMKMMKIEKLDLYSIINNSRVRKIGSGCGGVLTFYCL